MIVLVWQDIATRIEIISVRHVCEAQARSTKEVFLNLEVFHIKFESLIKNKDSLFT